MDEGISAFHGRVCVITVGKSGVGWGIVGLCEIKAVKNDSEIVACHVMIVNIFTLSCKKSCFP